jgi:hypothetical protein
MARFRAACVSLLVAAAALATCGSAVAADTQIVPGESIGGVALGTSKAALEAFLGYRGEHSSTRTSDVKHALDETYGYLRITFVPCSLGQCIAAIATSSPAFVTPEGVHVQSPVTKLHDSYANVHCGQLRAPSDSSQPDGFCKLGFAASRSGTTFLTIRDVVTGRVEVKTIAVAANATRWNVDPTAGIYGPVRAGSSSGHALILAAVVLVLLIPVGRLVWFFRTGGQLDAGGSDGTQLSTRKRRRRRRN